MNSPTVSVVVPTYNHESFIEQALNSILAQKSSFSMEILLGEDESSDKTRELCIHYSQLYPSKIKLHLGRREDVIFVDGVATGRANLIRLLSKAQGDYIALCEGDDYWTCDNKLQKQIDFLEKNREYSGATHITSSIDETEARGRVYGEGLQPDVFVDDLISSHSRIHTSSLVVRRQSLPWPLPTWFSTIISADMALFVMIANEGKLRFFDEEMSVYRKHSGGLTNQDAVIATIHEQRVKLMDCFESHLPPKFHERIRLVRYFHQSNIEFRKLHADLGRLRSVEKEYLLLKGSKYYKLYSLLLALKRRFNVSLAS